eukprot:jgi/Chrzof1/13801/Cz08g12270.t1
MGVSQKQDTENSITTTADEERPLLKDSANASQAKGLFDKAGDKAGSDASLPFYFIFVYYAFSSGTLLIINKVVIGEIPAPIFIIFCQLMTAAVLVRLAQAIGWIVIEPLTFRQQAHFFPVVVFFVGTLFSNIKVLQYSNVETFITFRGSTPLVLAVCDWLFLGRQLPSLKSWASLTALVVSCAGYALLDSSFEIKAYMWLLVWYLCFTIDALWVKHVCNSINISNWGRVYHTNLLSGLTLLAVWPFMAEERKYIATCTLNTVQLCLLCLSCAVGVTMSHASWLMRSKTTATAASVVGIVCKLITVALNIVIWDKHASPAGLVFVLLSIISGATYRQAPLREAVQSETDKADVRANVQVNALSDDDDVVKPALDQLYQSAPEHTVVQVTVGHPGTGKINRA